MDYFNCINFKASCPCVKCKGKGHKIQWYCEYCAKTLSLKSSGEIFCSWMQRIFKFYLG